MYTRLFALVAVLSAAPILVRAGETKLSQPKELTPEEKAQAEFSKAMGSSDFGTRRKAITAFAESKPVLARSWQMLYQVAGSDPDAAVRLQAYQALAGVPAHDTSVVKLLITLFNSLKLNDWKDRVSYAQAMKASEFKADLADKLADQLSKMRYPEDTKGYGKISDKAKEEIKDKRKELTDMLEAFNDIAKSSVTTADKEMPAKVHKWWEANRVNFEKADGEILSKYAKADAEAAQKEKEAKLAASKK